MSRWTSPRARLSPFRAMTRSAASAATAPRASMGVREPNQDRLREVIVTFYPATRLAVNVLGAVGQPAHGPVVPDRLAGALVEGVGFVARAGLKQLHVAGAALDAHHANHAVLRAERVMHSRAVLTALPDIDVGCHVAVPSVGRHSWSME